jgi:hypothetical protein
MTYPHAQCVECDAALSEAEEREGAAWCEKCRTEKLGLLPPADPNALECSHCGGHAIVSPDGLFADGEGAACITCGFPGHVVCDSETPADWRVSDDENARCVDASCQECCQDCPHVTGGVCSKHAAPEPVEY